MHNRKASTAAYVYLSNLVPVSAGSDIIVNKKHHNQNANNVVTNGHSYWKPHGHCNGGQYGRHSLLLSYMKAMTGDTSQACRLHMGLQFLEALVRSHVDKFWKFISWKIGKSIFWSDFLRVVVDELYMRFDFRVGSLCSVKFCTCCCLLPRRAWIGMIIKPRVIYTGGGYGSTSVYMCDEFGVSIGGDSSQTALRSFFPTNYSSWSIVLSVASFVWSFVRTPTGL